MGFIFNVPWSDCIPSSQVIESLIEDVTPDDPLVPRICRQEMPEHSVVPLPNDYHAVPVLPSCGPTGLQHEGVHPTADISGTQCHAPSHTLA